MTRIPTLFSLALLMAGCSDTHDYVGIWCGSVNWSWSYTYFDTEYEEPNFRVEDTCWMVGRTHQALTSRETLQVSGGEVPDGWCQYRAPESDRALSTSSECGFLMPAQDQSGHVFTLEQFWRLESGSMNLSGFSLDMEAKFKTATYFDGNELWGEAEAFYSGTKTPDLEPLEPVGGLYDERDECALDGCWQGSFAGNVVTGPASCESLLSTFSWDGVRFVAENGARTLSVDGEDVPTFPYLQSCEVVARSFNTSDGDWSYRIDESTPGQVMLEIELEAEAPGANPEEMCQLYWHATGGQCPS